MSTDNPNKLFWENYYKTNTDDITNASSFAVYVHETYLKKYNESGKYFKIADLGSGNSRDSIFFSKSGNTCYAIDYNGTIDKHYTNCNLIKKDVYEALDDYENKSFDMIYMRWFLHAMAYNKGILIFKKALNSVKLDGLIFIEVRSKNDLNLVKNSVYDKTDNSYTTTHKRWPYSKDMLTQMAVDNNCEIISLDEGYFSLNNQTETNNPLLLRVILKKK